MGDDDLAFRALADPTRRLLLDSLRRHNGQTLGELCGPLHMARQSATQHLGVLEAARLITTTRQGRQKLHYLNPVPLWEIQRRWIDRFELPTLHPWEDSKQGGEEEQTIKRADDVYVTYIHATPERVWEALTDAELTSRYWGHSNVSDWRVGSSWEHRRIDGSGIVDVTGTVLESNPPSQLVMTFDARADASRDGKSKVAFHVDAYHEIVRLTVIQQDITGEQSLKAVSAGWPAVFANLKSMLETGHVLPQSPWEMHG